MGLDGSFFGSSMGAERFMMAAEHKKKVCRTWHVLESFSCFILKERSIGFKPRGIISSEIYTAARRAVIDLAFNGSL